MPHLPWCCGGTKCCCQKYSSSSWLFALPLDTQEDDDVVRLRPPQLHLQFLFFIASLFHSITNKAFFPTSNTFVLCHQVLVRILSAMVLFWSSLCCYFLLFCPLLSSDCCGMLLKRAADVEEELEEKAADSVLLKLESVCQGTSIYPSVSGIHPFVHQPIFSLARRNVQRPQEEDPEISILQLLCSGEDRVRGRPDHNRIWGLII